MTEHKHAAVLRAIAEGRAVEFRTHHLSGHYEWHSMNESFNPLTCPAWEWRIKPEPRTPRRIWVGETELRGGITVIGSHQPFDGAIEFIEVLPDE